MVLAVIPAWTAPAAQEIRDAHRIATALGSAQPDAHTVRAVAATIGWVTGGQPSPLTGRPVGDVAEAVVHAEMMLASAVPFGDSDLPADVWASLGVEPAAAITGHHGWALGVAAATAWLLGVTDRSPVALPVRLPDGRVADADTLYAARMARHHRPEPEQRAAARRAAEQEAARSAQLAALADSVTA